MIRHFDTIMHTFLLGIIIAFFAWAVALSGTVSDILDTLDPADYDNSQSDRDHIDSDPAIPGPVDEPYCPPDNNGRDNPSPECWG